MKTPPASLIALLALVLLAAGDAQSRDLTTAEFRKFRGRYTGVVSGIAGNATVPQVVIRNLPVSFVVTSKSGEMLFPMVRNLYTAPKHRIVWRKPTGTPRRAILVGLYRGRFTNASGVSITVGGTRKVVMTDRGASAPKRYIAKVSDDLKETFTLTGGTSAAEVLNGTALK